MTFEEYAIEARKTMDPSLTDEQKAEYCSLKLVEEVGELAGSYAKQMFHNAKGNDLEELGDICWYLANIEKGSEANRMISRESIKRLSKEKLLRILVGMSCDRLLNNDDHTGLKAIARVEELETVIAYAEKCGLTMDQVYKYNIAKLKERHGDAYRAEYYTSDKGNKR